MKSDPIWRAMRQAHEEAARREKAVNNAHQPGKVVYPFGNGNVSRHKCCVCGRTEEDDAELEFRFCTGCNGNYEYCSDHIYTHEHKA